jgi:KDO2-lipid IV(A) lauroyltransferase
MKGIPMTVVGRRIYYSPYNRWISDLRSSVRVKVLYQDANPRELLRCLKRNEVVGLLPDQDVDRFPGIYVDFFGRPAYTAVAPVKLALKTGAPILIGFLIRGPHNRYRLVLRGVLRPVIETTYEEAVEKYTIQWMNIFEGVIREYPEQWMWMHDRWKTRQSPAEMRPIEKGS